MRVEEAIRADEVNVEGQAKTRVLFDGDCGVCSWSADLVKRLGRPDLFEVVPYFEYTEPELARFGLDYQQCVEYLCVVGPDQRVYKGAAAVNFVGLRLFPFSIAFALLYVFPFVLPLEALVYDAIAKNRTSISGLFGLNACKVRALDDESQ